MAMQFSQCKKFKIMRIAVFWGNFIPSIKITMNCWSHKIGPNILPMSWVYHNFSFLLTLALKTRMCVMTLLVQAWSKFNPNLIEILLPLRLPMGSWLGTNIPFIILNVSHLKNVDIIHVNITSTLVSSKWTWSTLDSSTLRTQHTESQHHSLMHTMVKA